MKYFKFFVITLLFIGCKKDNQTALKSKQMLIIEQDYNKAKSIALQENKLLFIDFYTTWCAPCKKLDKLVFQDDSIKNILRENFVMLKYDAENDTVFHLSKKHNIGSYPTGMILNKEGFVLNRKYGFPGRDKSSLQKSVLKFTNEAIDLNKEKKYLKGYSNDIQTKKYPSFYKDYINRAVKKVDTSQLAYYLRYAPHKLSEEYFSTLVYFGRDAPADIANTVLKNKDKYIRLYGQNDVDILCYFLTSAKFNRAISDMNQAKYNDAVQFSKSALSESWVNDILPGYEKDYLKAQNKWDEVFQINQKLKSEGKFDNDYVNYFSWQIYEKCEDPKVIEKCIEWMKEVTQQEPNYVHFDTYAHLLHKSGNQKETQIVIELAIEAAKKENKSTKKLEELKASQP